MAPYIIKSIEQVEPPLGSTNSKWYKFIIENNLNTIVNLRSGSKKEVSQFAFETVNRLNEKYLTHIKFNFHKPVQENFLATYN